MLPTGLVEQVCLMLMGRGRYGGELRQNGGMDWLRFLRRGGPVESGGGTDSDSRGNEGALELDKAVEDRSGDRTGQRRTGQGRSGVGRGPSRRLSVLGDCLYRSSSSSACGSLVGAFVSADVTGSPQWNGVSDGFRCKRDRLVACVGGLEGSGV